MSHGAKKQRIALIGAGMAVAPHLASLQELAARVEVAWIVGRTPERIGHGGVREQGRGAARSQSLLRYLFPELHLPFILACEGGPELPLYIKRG